MLLLNINSSSNVFPSDNKPKTVFVRCSNVGWSSLRHSLFARKGLAKINYVSGKTRLINYSLINQELYFVNLQEYENGSERWLMQAQSRLVGIEPSKTQSHATPSLPIPLKLQRNRVHAVALACGGGPSSKRWPRCAPHRPQSTSVRIMP